MLNATVHRKLKKRRNGKKKKKTGIARDSENSSQAVKTECRAHARETKRNKTKVRLPILYQYHPALKNRTTNEKRYYFYDLSIDGLYVVGLV